MADTDHSAFHDLDGLAIFVAIVEGGTLAAAGRALGLPNATLSRRLANLERALGTRLLARTTRRWSLTDPGRELYARVAPLVASLNEAARGLRADASEPSGLIRVTAPGGLGQSLLAPVINRFLACTPRVRVELLLREDLADLVAEGIDIAVRTGALEDGSLISRRLGENAFWLVASPDYLAERGTPISPADLGRHVAILRSPADDSFHLVGADGPVDVKIPWRLAVSGMVPQLHAALEGTGIALLPERFVTADVAAGRLVRLELGAEPPTRPMTMLFAKGQVQTAAVRRLADFLVAEFTG